jgi:hypothetical protein
LLHVRVHLEAGGALALTPVAIVVDERCEAGLLEAEREVIEVVFFEACELGLCVSVQFI